MLNLVSKNSTFSATNLDNTILSIQFMGKTKKVPVHQKTIYRYQKKKSFGLGISAARINSDGHPEQLHAVVCIQRLKIIMFIAQCPAYHLESQFS